MGRPSTRLWGVLVLVVALIAAATRVTTRATGAGLNLGAPWAMGDFRNVMYYPVRDFLAGGNPYDRAGYHQRYPQQEPFPPFLPATLLIHAPLGAIPLQIAEACYAVIIIVLTAVAARLGFRRSNGGDVAGATGLTLLSHPGQWNLLLGQVTLEPVLMCHAALRWARSTPLWAGIALGASTFKPTYGVPLAILMLARGDVRTVAIGVVAGIALSLPVAAVLAYREGGVAPFVATLVGGQQAWTGGGVTGHRWTETAEFHPTAIHRIDLVALGGRLLPQQLAGVGTELLVTIAVLGFASIVVRRVAREAPDRVGELSDPIICVAILLSIYHLSYDILFLLPFAVALVRRDVSARLQHGAMRWVVLTAVVGLAANYASTQAIVDRLGQNRTAWLALTSINPVLLLVLLLAYSAVALEAIRSVRVPYRLGGVAAR